MEPITWRAHSTEYLLLLPSIVTINCCAQNSVLSTLVHHNLLLTSLLQCRTQCLLLSLSLSVTQSVYRLSLSCCSAEHSVCYCACPSQTHSQCTVCLCPAAVQNTLSGILPVPLSHSQCTVCLYPAAVQNTVSATVPVPLSQSVYRLSLSCCSAEYNVCYCSCPSLPHRGHSIVSQHFMEPEGSIPNSQELSTCSYP
jgi:hypothetical protein